MRESGQSWKELLVDLKARGLSIAPDIAVGDGALGFWKALDEAFPATRHQRCWQHKSLNVLDKLPKSVQPNAHRDLHEIWLSESRAAADAAITIFADRYAPKRLLTPLSMRSPPNRRKPAPPPGTLTGRGRHHGFQLQLAGPHCAIFCINLYHPDLLIRSVFGCHISRQQPRGEIVMTHRSSGQSWALDIALAQGGFNALHPEAKGTLQQLGHDPTDFDRVFNLVNSSAMLPKAWATIASEVEKRAHHYDERGYRQTAADLYVRAAVMWGRAQYSIFDATDPRKSTFRDRVNHCVARLGALRDNRVRRVVLDFEGSKIFALLHLPAGKVVGAPAVILGPGMDMIKEDYIYAADRYYAPRGMVALSIEGPGQGETRANGLKVDLTNYERAISAYIDYLANLPEVDADRIAMFGISMSGYWGHRAAASDARLKALASFEGVTGDFTTIFERAQPTFKANYMFMTGYTDEDKFDEEIASKMPLGDLVSKISCPMLVGIGEFDELTHIEQAIESYERITAPKEMRVYENEFHPLGGVAAEIFRYGADWLERVFAGELSEAGRDVRYYVQRSGDITEGSADPAWWLNQVPPKIAAVRKTS